MNWLVIIFLLVASPAFGAVPSYPGCEGFGCDTIGGRGGTVVYVTNLNDSGAGSLRDALMMTVPRIIMFKLSGTIYLNSAISINSAQSYVTVAGQSAPGDGIAIAPAVGAESYLETGWTTTFQEGIFRHLRFRAGRGGSSTANEYRFAIFVAKDSHHIVLDHNSFTWGNDQTINQAWAGTDSHDINWSWNIIGEGGGQNAASMIGLAPITRTTFHHNYVVHSFFRNYTVSHSGAHEFYNDVHYNFGWNYHFNAATSLDIVGHYFKRGPTWADCCPPFDVNGQGATGTVALYLTGNKLVDINEALVGTDADLIGVRNGGTYSIKETPNAVTPTYPVTVETADQAKVSVLAKAGPRPLDAVDTRLLGDFSTGTGYSLSNVGVFPTLNTGTVPTDTDGDGMPDSWETARGLNPNNAADGAQTSSNSYTHVENYLNGLAGDTIPGNPYGASSGFTASGKVTIGGKVAQ